MTDRTPISIQATREFQRKVRSLTKKYRHLQTDLQPILEALSLGQTLGDRIPRIHAVVYQLRVKNSDTRKGKSGGYRLIYWLRTSDSIVLLDIYTKSEQDDIAISSIQRIIENFQRKSSS